VGSLPILTNNAVFTGAWMAVPSPLSGCRRYGQVDLFPAGCEARKRQSDSQAAIYAGAGFRYWRSPPHDASGKESRPRPAAR
jgi:hypothetical protein